MKKIGKKNIRDILALTPMQESMLYHYLMEPGTEIYFEQLSLSICGPIDISRFEQAWNFVIETNEMLRVVFRWEKMKNPVQMVLKRYYIKPKFFDLSTKASEKKESVEKIKTRDKKEKFDLQEVPFRITLCKFDEDSHVMIISHHHILYDGWSTGIILGEFFEAYDKLSKRSGRPLKPPVKTKFKEHIQWIQNRAVRKEEKFWKEYLAGFDTITELPIKIRKGKEKKINESANYKLRFSKDFVNKMEDRVKRYKITLATLLYAGWGILLQKYSNRDDVMFGTTVSGRSIKIKGIENTVGLFINTLPLRVQNRSNENIRDVLCQIQQRLKEREVYENTPLVNINAYRPGSNNEELFDSIVTIENYPLDDRLDGKTRQLSISSYSMFEMTHYDLTVLVSIFKDIEVTLSYPIELFDKETIKRLAGHFVFLLQELVENPEKSPVEIEIVSEGEKRRLLFDFSCTRADFPRDRTLHQLFEQQVGKKPDHIALIGPKLQITNYKQIGGNVSVTFKELSEKSNHLAHLLIEKGVKPDTTVAIMVERSLEMIIGILGILKAGGAYLPIDPQYPEERINYMLADSAAKKLLTADEINGAPTPRHLHLPPAPATSLAYVIYTSGSTGKPKGVLVTHHPVVNLLSALQKEYPIEESDTYLLKTSYMFDVSVTELFGWYVGNGKLAIMEPNGEKDPAAIVDTIEKMGVTHINFVPSMFNVFVEELSSREISKLFCLKYIFLAGETLLPGLVNKFKRINTQARLENIYGPTEGVVYSSNYSLSVWDGSGTIPIGSPLQNIKLYILDKDNHFQPVGAPGELCIGGVGLARGYLNKQELTHEKFKIKNRSGALRTDLNTFGGNKKVTGSNNYMSQRSYMSYIYCTGDLARWLTDGNIEFLGRRDQQVKIRGFRIELGEIQDHLLNHKNIKEAVVTLNEDEGGDKFLCAYIVSNSIFPSSSSNSLTTPGLQKFLSRQLPGYMIPAHFVELERIPLTPGGKVDRKALPEVRIKGNTRYIAPRDTLEKKLLEIWADVLGKNSLKVSSTLGINDNFFACGGHSLKAVRLVFNIHKEFHIRISPGQIFKTPTIKGLAEYIKNAVKEKYVSLEPIEKRDYYTLSSAQNRLYILQQMYPGQKTYNVPAVMVLEGKPEMKRLEETFQKLIKRHESFRTSFHMKDNKPVLRIQENVKFSVEYFDLTTKAIENTEGTRGLAPLPIESAERKVQSAKRLVQSVESKVQSIERDKERDAPCAMRCANTIKKFIRHFDLSRPPLLRVELIEIEEKRHLLMVDMHHIITDGASIQITAKQFMELYQGKELPRLKLQYKDFLQWQNKLKENKAETLIRQQDYWWNLFAGEIPVLNLPIDYASSSMQNFEGNTLDFSITGEQTQGLKELAVEEGVSLFMILLAVFNLLLAKVSGQEDIVTATGVEGRKHQDLIHIIGMFVNILALRNYPRRNQPFNRFLHQLKERTLEAFENQDYLFENLVEKLYTNINWETGRNPLFDVMFQFNDREFPEMQIPGLKLKPYKYDTGISKFDLTLWGFEQLNHNSLVFKFEYCSKLFKRKTIDLLIIYFKEIVYSILEDRHQCLSEIQEIPGERKEKILSRLNQVLEEETGRMIRGGQIFQHQLIEKLMKFEDKIAIEYGTRALTYKELDKRSNCIANHIGSKGIKKETLIGIFMNDGTELIITIIGVLKAGCVFVPLDCAYPKDRLELMIRSLDIPYIMCDKGNLIQFSGSGVLRFHGDGTRGERLYPVQAPTPRYQPEDKIYIYFTSGTTGVPKAIVGKNSSLLHFIQWEIDTFGIDETFRFSQLSAPGFDAFLRDVFAPLCSGGVICIPANKEVILNAGKLLHWLECSRVNLVSCVPSLFRLLTTNSLTGNHLPSLKVILFSGERITASDLETWFDTFAERIKLVNLWGTSETTLAKTYHFIKKTDAHRERIPVGKPIRGAGVMVMDDHMRLCDQLVIGELYIRTPFRSWGYYNDSDLNNRRFIRNPFSNDTGDLIHKTGDLGRILTDGTIDLLGRSDRQVKIRGIRIELEEIERVLQGCPLVKQAVVIKKELSQNNELLCAYIIENEKRASLERQLLVTRVNQYLLKKLPGYMVPAAIIKVKEFPRTPNGKVDYKALTHLEEEPPGYSAPETEVEKKLVLIWAEILDINIKQINTRDHFFRLGGNSLNVMSLISRIHREFEVRIPLGMIFNNPTIKKQARIIKNEKKEIHIPIEPVEKKEYYALTSAQNRLYILQQMDAAAISYNMPMKLKIEGDIDKEKIEESFRRLIKRQESFRTSFVMVGDLPMQRIHHEVEFKIELGTTGHFQKPFDLSKAPLLRVGLIQEGKKGEYLLMVDMHHIISDGISLAVIVKELLALYEGKELSTLPIQYKDFSQWQNSRLASTQLRKQEEYWLNRFKGKITGLNLPTDHPRPEIQRFEGEKFFFKIHKELTGSIQRLVRETDTTMFIFLLAAFTLLLSKYSQQEDITVGSPITGRTHEDVRDIVGMFVNMLAIRNYPSEEKTFIQFLEEVKENSLKAYENQDYQFEALVNKLNLGGKLDGNPLFDTAFSLEDIGIYQMETGSLKLIPCEYEREISQFDLILKGIEDKKNDGINMVFYYSTALFKRATAEKMKDHYLEILQQVVENKHTRLKEIIISHHLSIADPGLEKEEVEFGF